MSSTIGSKDIRNDHNKPISFSGVIDWDTFDVKVFPNRFVLIVKLLPRTLRTTTHAISLYSRNQAIILFSLIVFLYPSYLIVCLMDQLKLYINIGCEMSEKYYKWKEISKTGKRLNSMMGAKRELPSKFDPTRDRSASVDKLFNSSRERLSSSMEIEALNQSQESIRTKIQPLQTSLRKDQTQYDKKFSMLRFPTLGLTVQQSSFNTEKNVVQSNIIQLSQLKKEFWSFKQNVLKQIDRQKQFLQKLLKEVILTVELELDKLRKQYQAASSESLNPQGLTFSSMPNSLPINLDKNTKTLQQWKDSLANISLAPKQTSHSFRSATSPAKFTSEEPKKLISPPAVPIDLQLFLKSIKKMKSQFQDIDRLLASEKGDAAIITTKK